jgi:hypothetical protein
MNIGPAVFPLLQGDAFVDTLQDDYGTALPLIGGVNVTHRCHNRGATDQLFDLHNVRPHPSIWPANERREDIGSWQTLSGPVRVWRINDEDSA